MSAARDPLEGLPPDLVRVLRDPSIFVPQDAAVFELIAKWMDAPSDTASAMTVDEWRQAWSVTCRRMVDALARAEAAETQLAEARRALEIAKDCRGPYQGTVSASGGYPALCRICVEKVEAALDAIAERSA